jgi:hypothetical protein
MTVEDPPDRAVGGRDPADEPELLAGRRARRAEASVERERAGLFELEDRPLGEVGNGGAIALRRAGGNVAEDGIEPGGVVALQGGYGRASNFRPVSRAKSMIRAV